MKKLSISILMMLFFCIFCFAQTKHRTNKTAAINIERILGFWFVPHSAEVNIRFYSDGKFEFSDYNSRLDKEETLLGEYTLRDETLTLLYNDRPKQNFKFHKKNGVYCIEKTGYYFVKGETKFRS